MCTNCQNKYVREHDRVNRAGYAGKARARNTEQTRISTEFMIEYFSHNPRRDCVESDMVILAFDHLRDKLVDTAVLARGGYAVEAITREIDKCPVVCANCLS